jgi:hypothetical protein
MGNCRPLAASRPELIMVDLTGHSALLDSTVRTLDAPAHSR